MNATSVQCDLSPVDGIVELLGRERAEASGRVGPEYLITLLQQIQEAYGYLPTPALVHLSKCTGIPASQIYGVATFYSQFRLTQCGRHTVRCCRGTACHVRGGKDVADTLARELNVEEGGTTEDMRFTLESVACLGTCFLAPVIMVDKDYYGSMTPGRIREVLDRYE